MSFRSTEEAIRAGWLARSGKMKGGDVSRLDYGYSKDFQLKWENPTAGLPDLSVFGINPAGQITIGGGTAVQPLYQTAIYTLAANADLADQAFFICNQASGYQVMGISEIHGTAGNASGAVTSVIKKCPSGITVANGTALMSNTFNMKGTANTLQTGTLSTDPAVLTLAQGDRLAIDYTGTLTTLAGVCVIVYLKPLSTQTLDVTFAFNANAQLVDSQFFIANDRYVVTAVRYSHAVAGTNASAVNVQLVKDTGTDAPGAGTNLLTDNSNAGFNCKGTINVPQVGTLTATAASLLLGTGDRLSADFSGTTTALAGVVMTVSLTPLSGRTEVSFFYPGAEATNTDQVFFIADRDYIARIASEVHAVAAGGTSTCQVVKDSGTDAPGAGTDLLLSAFNLDGTAQTVDPDLLAAAPYTVRLRAADRLSVDFAHAAQASSGVCITVGLDAA